MRKIAVIGHKRIIKPIVEAIQAQYSSIEILEIEFVDTALKAAAVEYIKAQSSKLDGLIFTGKRPYDIINAAIGITIPQVYIVHDRSIFLQTILQAIHQGYSIDNFSCDSYGEEEIIDAFKGFAYQVELMNIYTAPKNIVGDNLVWELFAFHKECFEKSELAFCITGISMVYEKLNEIDIPCLLMQPTQESVNNGVQQLWMKINAIRSSESQIVVLAIEVDLPNEYHLIHDNEYQLMLEKSKISEQVYKFSESIQAAVVESGPMSYMLFSTRKILESTTNQLNTLPILASVKEHTSHTISMGIGYGRTGREAKFNAMLGLNRAIKDQGNQAVYVKDGKYSEPILPKINQEVVSISDPLYKVVSEASGISINNIYRLHCIKEEYKKNLFTSSELAEAFGNSRRSMDRIIEKLERAGYAAVDGKRMMSDIGRPTRIIRLKF